MQEAEGEFGLGLIVLGAEADPTEAAEAEAKSDAEGDDDVVDAEFSEVDDENKKDS